MYNQNIKERFLIESVRFASRVESERRFNVISWHESQYKKDLAEMSAHEAKSALNSIEFTEAGSLDSYMSTFRKYVEWCRDNGVFEGSIYGFLELSSDDVDPSVYIARTFFRDESDLIRSMSMVRDLYNGHAEVIVTLFVWLGIDIRDAIRVKDSEIDLESRKIYNSDGQVIVYGFSDKIYQILYEYTRCKSGTRGPRDVVKDMSYDYFIKRFTTPLSSNLGKPMSYGQVRNYVNEMNGEYISRGYPSRFAPENVMRSGCLFRIYNLEMSGVDVMSKDAELTIMRIYKKSNPYRIRWQYENYKKAFNL